LRNAEPRLHTGRVRVSPGTHRAWTREDQKGALKVSTEPAAWAVTGTARADELTSAAMLIIVLLPDSYPRATAGWDRWRGWIPGRWARLWRRAS
jgi:hypothetical protein